MKILRCTFFFFRPFFLTPVCLCVRVFYGATLTRFPTLKKNLGKKKKRRPLMATKTHMHRHSHTSLKKKKSQLEIAEAP